MEVAGRRGWAVSGTVQRAPPIRCSTPSGVTRRGQRGRAAAGVRLRRRSGLRRSPGMARWRRGSVLEPRLRHRGGAVAVALAGVGAAAEVARRQWSGTWPRCAASARCRARGHGTSRRWCGARCGGATRVVAAMSTRTAGGAAAPAIGWRSTTSCRSRSAALRSRRISESAAVPTTGCATLMSKKQRAFGTDAARAPRRGRETERAGGQPKATGAGGWIASPAKRRGRADGGGREAGVGGARDRATCAADPRCDAERRDAARAAGWGGRWCPASAAKRLAAVAGRGAVATGERSGTEATAPGRCGCCCACRRRGGGRGRPPAVERHLAALRGVGAVPGSRPLMISRLTPRARCCAMLSGVEPTTRNQPHGRARHGQQDLGPEFDP